jgi:transposase
LEAHVRVCTAFNRILDLPGAAVVSVEFTDQGLVLGLRRSRRRKLACPCGLKTWAYYDGSRRRWRHLDFGATRVHVEADVYRVNCRRCGRVRTEQVPWARANARHTRDFEDVVGWLAQRMDKTAVATLLRCSWEAVDNIARRLVAEKLDKDRLNNLYRIGVDEISYRRRHKYLTVVADHDSGHVIWVTEGRTRESFEAFFDELGPERAAGLEAITLDGSAVYRTVAKERAGQAIQCIDPFHVIKWCNETLDAFYRSQPGPPKDWLKTGHYRLRSWRGLRFALRSGAENLDDNGRALLNGLRRLNYRLYRAWQLKEALRELFRSVHPDHARAYLKRWCYSANRSRIRAFELLAGRIQRHFDGIIAAVQLGLSNSRLEGHNAKIRVIQRRGYGHPTPESLTAMIYLCLGGIKITLPTQR